MPFSEYLDSMREDCRGLVAELGRYFDYVSILGTDVRATVYRADRKLSMVREGAGECGFVIKMHSGRSFYEYSCDSIEGDKKALAAKIAGSVKIAGELTERQIKTREVADTPMKKDFSRENDFADYTDSFLLGVCKKISDDLAAKDEKVLNAIGMIQPPYRRRGQHFRSGREDARQP